MREAMQPRHERDNQLQDDADYAVGFALQVLYIQSKES